MLARKKYIVPKSYRIDHRFECDMHLLSQLTNRSQNDLVNAAIEGFLQDNAEWFLKNALVEHFKTVLDHTYEKYDHFFKMGGLEVSLEEGDTEYKLHVSINRGIETMDDDYEKCISISDDGAEDKLEEYLRNLGAYIDPESDDSKEYLKDRLDYRDYVPNKREKRKIDKK